MNRSGWIAKRFACLLVLSCLAASPALAQDEGVELGVDGLLAFRLFDDEFSGIPVNIDDAFLVAVPVKIRAGFPISSRLSMEPSLAFDVLSVGGNTVHEVDLGLSFLRNLGGERGKTTPFLRVAGIYHVIGDPDETNSQLSASGTVGVRLPMADRLDFRVELGTTRHFSNDDFIGSWDVGSAFGISFYTR